MFQDTEISNLRKKYGPLFSTEIRGRTVYFREITFNEFDNIIKTQELEDGSMVDSEDEIIRLAVVYPTDFDVDRMPAGLVSRPCSRNIKHIWL
jgi:hypothetical protein